MPSLLTNLMEKIDSRILRERILIFLTLLAAIFFIWNFLLQAKYDNQRTALKSQQTQIITEQRNSESQLATLTQSMASDPAIAKKNEIDALTRKIEAIEAQLSSMGQGLISAELLPKVLEEVLQRTSKVKLLQVRTLPATELQLAAVNTGVNNSQQNANGTGVYKHGVFIRVAGSYSQLIKLMQEIESLDSKFYWEALDYTVNQYPEATIDIRVFTLSSEEGLLGV
jgi:MSHA biogenesis protein MshJ